MTGDKKPPAGMLAAHEMIDDPKDEGEPSAAPLPEGTELLCDVAPGWVCKLDAPYLIIAHPDSVPLAIPISSIKAGDRLPRLDDFVKYKIDVN